MTRLPFSGRRGMIFLIGALFLVAVALIVVAAQRSPTEADRAQSAQTRIATMNDFLRDFNVDSERAAYIATYHALIAIEQHVTENGAYRSDLDVAFREAFLDGTINGTAYAVMENSTFNDYVQRVNVEARKLGFALAANVTDVALSQRTPWSVHVTYALAVNLTDTRRLARWDSEGVLDADVPILDLRDPVYSVSTYGKVPNTIRKSPYGLAELVVGNDTANLNDEAVHMYYREDPYAPSYLQRLAGDLSPSVKYGIASLVNLDELNAQGVIVKNGVSTVDYLYFNGTGTTNYCPAFGDPLPSWLKIDEGHYLDPLRNYELDDLNATTC